MQALATEMFKIYRDLSPDILGEIFVPKISLYNFRKNNTFERRQIHSVYHGTESLSFQDPKVWNLMPLELKQLEYLPMENKEMDSLRMPLQIVSSLYTTSWVCFSQKD